MRNEFVAALTELAERDERVVVLTGDLGFGVLDDFARRFPDRFFNVGVAEQNMTGLATGLAEAGLLPFTYSIATFASMRPYELLRGGAIAHGFPVRVLGIGGGFDYGSNGLSHYALEDIGLMRLQPGIATVVPADAAQAVNALHATLELDGPVYFRLAKDGPAVPGLDSRFELGRAAVLGDGADIALLAIGTSAHAAVDAAAELAAQGVAPTVVVVPGFNPSPDDDVAEVLDRVDVAVTVEAHYATGGLGSWTAELIAERGLGTRLVRCAVREMPAGVTGSTRWMEDRFGISAARVAQAATGALALEPRG